MPQWSEPRRMAEVEGDEEKMEKREDEDENEEEAEVDAPPIR